MAYNPGDVRATKLVELPILALRVSRTAMRATPAAQAVQIDIALELFDQAKFRLAFRRLDNQQLSRVLRCPMPKFVKEVIRDRDVPLDAVFNAEIAFRLSFDQNGPIGEIDIRKIRECYFSPPQPAFQHQPCCDSQIACHNRKKVLDLVGRVDGNFWLLILRRGGHDLAINPSFTQPFTSNHIIVKYGPRTNESVFYRTTGSPLSGIPPDAGLPSGVSQQR